jgi:hypothetical protein
MREWSLQAGDPLSLTLAADMRLCKPDYLNDQIWELEVGGGEPAAMAVRTTYGLRARSMRLFYRFSESGRIVTNPAEFFSPPRLRRFHTNFLLFNFVPFEGLEVTAEYWVPESHALAGRVTILNKTTSARKLNFEICGSLTPLDGQSLAFTQQQMVNILAGASGGLSPVLFMTGGPISGSGPHPSLVVERGFEPGKTHAFTWSTAAEASAEASFELARHAAARPWDAERTRIELLDTGDILEIFTGDADWDAALALSQKAALASFYPASKHLPNPSFVRSRNIDSGYSHSGDGLDYPPSWSGQSSLEAWYLSSLLPVAPQLKRGLLENFFSVQSQNGSIDGRPGLGGQRAKFLAAPLLASLAWDYYQVTQQDDFLAQVFPKLNAFFQSWFLPDHDTDRDGIPEWDHVLQVGFDDHPLFDVWHPWSQGVSISALFNPELESLLYREATSLILMAEKLGLASELGQLHQEAAILRTSVEASWNANTALYCYRDRLTGVSTPGKLIGRHKGSGDMRPKKAVFEQAVRLLIEIQTKNQASPKPVIEISGLDRQGENVSEVVGEHQFQWRSGGLVATSLKVYTKVRHLKVHSLEDTDKVILRSVDSASEDITLFTPIWAHLADQAQVQEIVTRSVLNASRFSRPFGVPALPSLPDPKAEAVALSVYLPWNQILGEGLLSYGFRNEAARLIGRMMNGIIQSLKQSRAFYERYNAETGSGIGERGALTGLAPVEFFLQTLGVTFLSPTRLRLEGSNPFAWPVTIVYKGLKVTRGLEATEVVFPNGKVVTVTDPAPSIISL